MGIPAATPTPSSPPPFDRRLAVARLSESRDPRHATSPRPGSRPRLAVVRLAESRFAACAVGLLLLLGGAAGAPRALAQEAGTLSVEADSIRLAGCIAAAIDDVEVPARATGTLREVRIREGAAVTLGQPLAAVDDSAVQRQREAVQAKLLAAERKAQSTVEIDYARAAFAVADSQYSSAQKLRQKQSVSQSEYEEAALERRRAELQIERTENDLAIERLNAQAQQVELTAIDDSIERHQILAPLDGSVFEIFKQAGEWVQAGERVARIVRMNRIRVQGFVAASELDPADLEGRPVLVAAELARGRRESFAGHVTYVALETFGASQGRYGLWAEVDNRMENGRWLLLPGSTVELTIRLQGVAVTERPPPLR